MCLARSATRTAGEDDIVSFSNKKTIIRTPTEKKWQQQHPNHRKAESYDLLTRSEQVFPFRLHAGHDRLNAHLFHRLKICLSEMCPCDIVPMTTEHFLQHCPLHVGLRGDTWPENRPLREKLYGDLAELTAAFARATGVDV